MNKMNYAYQVAATAVLQRLAEQDPQGLDALSAIGPGEVAVYEGSFDQSGKALELLGITYHRNPMGRQMLGSKVIFANCTKMFNQDLIENATEFVAEGGLLVSSDWAIKHVIEPCFPGMVRHNGRQTNEEVIAVEPDLNSVWEDVVVLGADPQWWLWCSYPIEVLDTDQVRVEAASHELMVRYDEPAVAISFDWGKGSVYHVISHFWAKKSGTPTLTHQGPFEDFLRKGMNLSESGIARVIDQNKRACKEINFAMVQSAATALELAAKLCIRGCASGQLPMANGQ